jgi:structural maintenance of chromosome 2
MFNNSNVIFRTKFVDGVSTVTKTMGVGSSMKARALTKSAATENEVASPGQKRVAGRQKGGKENSTIIH